MFSGTVTNLTLRSENTVEVTYSDQAGDSHTVTVSREFANKLKVGQEVDMTLRVKRAPKPSGGAKRR